MSTKHTTIDYLLGRFAIRRRRMRAIGLVCLAIAAAIAWLILIGLLDRWLQLPPMARLITICALLGVLLLTAVKVIRLIVARRYDPLVTAGQVESLRPQLGERLLTLITQQTLPPAQRGSPALVQRIADDVDQQLSAAPPERLVTHAQLRPVVLLLAAMILITAALCFVGPLGLPRLISRQLMPLADIPPVTTTQIDVATGSVDLPQGQSLAIVADVTRGDGNVTLLVGQNENDLQPVVMPRTFGDRFSVTLPTVEHDLIYRVASGDARTSAYNVRVLRRPALAKLQLSMEFPPYLKRPPLNVAVSDGQIEALRGTVVKLKMQATEPLTDAILRIGDKTFATTATIDPFVREAEFAITASTPWSVALTSDRGVKGAGGNDMKIIAVEDRPPTVQLARSDLRLHPSDVVAIPFQALDDFGIDRMRLDVTLGETSLLAREIDLTGDRRLVRDVATVDLAPMALAFGDLVTIAVTATDGASQSRSSACRVLLAPRSVDARLLTRIEAIAEALRFAENIPREPADAVSCMRALLRVLAASDNTPTNDLIERFIDQAQQIVSSISGTNVALAEPQLAMARELAGSLRTLYGSEQSRLLVAELENIRSVDEQKKSLTPPEVEALKQSIARARAELDRRLKGMAIDPRAPDVDKKLDALVRAGEALARDSRRETMESIARRWVEAKPEVAPRQGDRVTIAAQAQMLRSDSDLIWARDLQLVARAMTRLQQLQSPHPAEMTPSVAALEKLHQLTRSASAEREKQLPLAEAARKKLREWATDPALATAPPAAPMDRAIEEAAALQEEHMDEPEGADAAGDDGPEKWQPPEEAGKAESAAAKQARKLDQIAKRQSEVAKKSQSATPAAAPALAGQQRQISSELGKLAEEREEDFFDKPAPPESREQSLEALRDAQRALADLPQQLMELRSQAQIVAGMKQAAQDAQAAAEAAAAEDKPAADRMSAEAQRQLAEARQQINAASGAAASSATAALQSSAAKLGSAGSSISKTLDDKFTPAMDALQKSLAEPDLADAENKQARVLDAIAELQASLRVAQRQTMDRDPIVAARFFARKAAEALEKQPPDLAVARSDQKQTSEAIERAWSAAASRNAKEKLAQVPAFRSLLFEDLVEATGTGGATPPAFTRTASPEWGRLAEKRDAAATGADGAFVPPGYEEPLKLYFQALDKARSGGKEP